MSHNLFDIERGCQMLKHKPRNATTNELRAYLQWVAERHGVTVPKNAHYHPAGIWCPTAREYIVTMPGHGQAQTVLLEVLGDDGEVRHKMTLPQDRRGGIPATATQVREWCGAEAKSAKTKRERRPTVDKQSIGKGAISRGKKALAMLTGEVPGMGRRALDNCFEMGDGGQVASYITQRLEEDRELAMRVYYGKRSYRAAYKGDHPETHWADRFLIPEWLAVIVRHGIIPLSAVNAYYGMRDKVAALLGEVAEPTPDAAPAAPEPVQAQGEDLAPDMDTPEALDALHGAPEPEFEAVELVSESYKFDDAPADHPAPAIVNDGTAGHGADLVDQLAAIMARLDAVEVALSAKADRSIFAASFEGEKMDTPPIADALSASRAKRSPAHERAIRRAWAERSARRAAVQDTAMAWQVAELRKRKRQASVNAAIVLRSKLKAERMRRAGAEAKAEREHQRAWDQWGKRRENAERARRMLAAVRERADLDRRALAATNAAYAKLKRDLADPTRPERASDIARLMTERDQARTSLAAVSARAERQQAALDQAAEHLESMGLRMAKAEAALRKAGLIAA